MIQIIKIAKDFSDTPGPRYIEEGEFSGQHFRDSMLLPAYEKCKAASDTLLIDLDDAEGYATSFLEEAFGGLARLFPKDDILKVISIKSEDEPFLKDEIAKYVQEANQ